MNMNDDIQIADLPFDEDTASVVNALQLQLTDELRCETHEEAFNKWYDDNNARILFLNAGKRFVAEHHAVFPVIDQDIREISLDEILCDFTAPYTLIRALINEGQSVELNMTTSIFRMSHEHMLKSNLTISQAVNLGDQYYAQEINLMRQQKLPPQTIFDHRKRAYEDWHAELK